MPLKRRDSFGVYVKIKKNQFKGRGRGGIFLDKFLNDDKGDETS